MPDILHRVGIGASPGRVFQSISTIGGLSRWWVRDTRGSAKKGGAIDFGFCDMKVTARRPGRLVKWKCVRGPKEWLGTTVSFQLVPKDGQTFVLFTHGGWKKPVEFMRHCSTKWATFLLSLRDSVEKGKGRPAPDDLKIHVGD